MRVAILGCGTMGSAFARQLKKAGHELVLFDRNREGAKALASELGATVSKDIQELKDAEILLLAIKPKDLEEASSDLGDLEKPVLLSILAGTSLSKLKTLFPDASVVRGMPNLALTCGEAVLALVEDEELSSNAVEKVNQLLEGMGLVFWTEESKMEAITSLAGSGPAFVIAFMEAMVESGVLMGLKSEEALLLTLQTVLGSVALLRANPEEHPAKLRWMVSAPGGTTIEGMRAFEEAGIRSGVMNTLVAAFEKAKKLH